MADPAPEPARSPPPSGRSPWIGAGKALLGVGLLVLVLSRLEWSRVLDLLAAPGWGWLALAVGLQAAAKLLWAARWRALLGAYGRDRRFRDLLAYLLIGHFFNSFFPTSVGGDLVRGYYVRSGEGGLMTSYGVVLVERLLGLGVLSLAAAGGTSVLLVGGRSGIPAAWLLAVLAVSVAATLALGAAFGWSGTVILAGRISRRLPRFGEELARLADGLGVFHRSGAARGRIVLYSALIQVTAILFYVACGHAVGLDVSPWTFLVVVPVTVVATMIPVTLNGLGVREGVLVGLLVAFGADPEPAGAMVLLALVVSVLYSILGAALFPFHRVRLEEVRRVGPSA